MVEKERSQSIPAQDRNPDAQEITNSANAEEEEEEGGTVVEYMLSFVQQDSEFFHDWR
ncbi:hypothetical protein MPER_04449 [Moniliophthora perniciosa FA553]|nr:hypothetical protein MPER_04449 [Moniliophthora perniciosa FA553]